MDRCEKIIRRFVFILVYQHRIVYVIEVETNLFFQAFASNWENVEFTSDDHIKSEYRKSFDFIWSRLCDSAVAPVRADVQHLNYVYRKNHIAQLPVNDVAFVMGDGLSFCEHEHTDNRETVKICENPLCKAKLSHKIIGHIESAKHLVCIAM